MELYTITRYLPVRCTGIEQNKLNKPVHISPIPVILGDPAGVGYSQRELTVLVMIGICMNGIVVTSKVRSH